MFEKLSEAVQRGIEKKLHYGVQASLSIPGKEFDLALGEVQPGERLRPNSSLCWLSAAKPITAVAIMQLQEQGKLEIDFPLAEWLPEWDGREPDRRAVTLWHLLTHTSPLAEVPSGWPGAEREQIVETICQAPLKSDWEPGQRAAYLPVRVSWFLLGAVIERCSGLLFEDYVQRFILDPLQMNQTRCHHSFDHPEEHPPMIYDRVRGELECSDYSRRLDATVPSPGSSFRGPALDLRLFYEALRTDLVAQTGRLLSSDSVLEMTRRQRVGLFDETLQHKVDYGLGVIIDSKDYGSETVPYGFGEQSSSETFGHGGSQCAIGFADPVRGRSVVLIANGRAGEGQHQRRFRELLAALEEDLDRVER